MKFARLSAGGNRIRTIGPALVKGLSAVADERCRTDKLDGVIKHRSSRETTMVGRGASLDGRLFLGGTDGSNPVPSSGESATNQCPAFGIPIGAIFLLRWSPPSRTDKAPIKEKTPAEEAGFSKIGDRSRGGPSPQCHRRLVEPLRKRRNVGFVSYAGR
jgi:hypothetical protein